MLSGNCLHTMKESNAYMVSVDITADGRYALSATYNGVVKIWEVSTAKCLHTLNGHSLLSSASFSADGRYVVSEFRESKYKIWELNWEVEARDQADWDDGAKPYLLSFLYQHRPIKKGNPLKRIGLSAWTEGDFEQLIAELGYRGYGWLRSAGVLAKLEEMRNNYDEKS